MRRVLDAEEALLKGRPVHFSLWLTFSVHVSSWNLSEPPCETEALSSETDAG